jgi:hypothetical protein
MPTSSRECLLLLCYVIVNVLYGVQCIAIPVVSLVGAQHRLAATTLAGLFLVSSVAPTYYLVLMVVGLDPTVVSTLVSIVVFLQQMNDYRIHSSS